MGWIGLSLLITLIVVLLIHWQERAPLKEWIHTDEYVIGFIVTLFMSLFLVGLIGGLYTGTSEGVVYDDDDKSHCEQWVNRWDIVSAVRERSISGSFILGTGGVSTVDRYYAYQQEEPGLMLTTYYTYKTYVVEQEGQPAYERIDWICPRPVADFLWWSDGHTKRNKGRTGTLYVPEGTILRKFEL